MIFYRLMSCLFPSCSLTLQSHQITRLLDISWIVSPKFIAFSSVFLSYCSLNIITELIVYVSVCPLESEFLKELCRNHFLSPEYLVSFSSGKCAEVKCLCVTVLSSWAAIKNHHKLRGLKEQYLFFHISGVKVFAGPYPWKSLGENPFSPLPTSGGSRYFLASIFTWLSPLFCVFSPLTQ